MSGIRILREEPMNEPATAAQSNNSQRGLGSMVEGYIDTYFEAHEGIVPSSGLYERVINEVEKPLLRATLKSVRGNQKRAAEILGMNRNTLRKKLSELRIDPHEF